MPGTVVDVQVAHPEGAFAATLSDSSVITWGYNNCNSLESDWLEGLTQWDRNYRFNIGINPDSSLAFQGCSYCNAGVLPLDSDFVYVWTDIWDQRFAGAIHEDGSHRIVGL